MMIIWVMTPRSPVNSHQPFVWRNLLPIFFMWERDQFMDELYRKGGGTGQRGRRRLAI
jgi:hypothetical protein